MFDRFEKRTLRSTLSKALIKSVYMTSDFDLEIGDLRTSLLWYNSGVRQSLPPQKSKCLVIRKSVILDLITHLSNLKVLDVGETIINRKRLISLPEDFSNRLG